MSVGSEAGSVLIAASILGVLLAVAGIHWLARNTGTRNIMRRLEEMQDTVSRWQSTHRARFSGLELRMTGIEVAVGSAEEDSHAASVEIAQIRGDLLRRLEELEQRFEIQRLVDQGRIPREHLSEDL